MAQTKSIEMSEVSIRRLRHGTNKRGEPATLKHPITGVKCLYLQCNPPHNGEKIGTRQWLYRPTIGSERPWLGLGGYPSVPTKTAKEEAFRHNCTLYSAKQYDLQRIPSGNLQKIIYR